jgi:hypothetical protein
LTTNTQPQLLVQRGLTLSLALRVDVAPAEPSIFNSGTVSSAVIYAFPPDGSSPYLATPATPARGLFG